MTDLAQPPDAIGTLESNQVDEELETAKRRVAGLVRAIGISVVISIDDLNATGEVQVGPGSLTETMAASPELNNAVVQLLAGASVADDFSEIDASDQSSVSDFVNASWQGFPADLREQLNQLRETFLQDRQDALSVDAITADLESREILRQLFEGVAEFRPLSMADWKTQQSSVLGDQDTRYLLLIDRSFSREGSEANEGENLLADVLQSAGDNVWAGLFTQTASDETAESDLTIALRQRFEGNASRIVAMGKFRALQVGTFPAGLRALLLVREISAYRDLVGSAMQAAAQAANDAFVKLNDYVIVESMAAARREGLFELEHPLRVAHRTYSEHLARAIRDQAFADAHLAAFRGGAIEAYRNAERDQAQIRALLRKDRFFPENFASELGLPVDVGDVFIVESLYSYAKGETAPLPRHFVLLGQACDLSVRTSGRREPEIGSVVLHEMNPRRSSLSQDSETNDAQADVGYFQADDGTLWIVKFKNQLTVPIEALDATVFNRDGRAVIDESYRETRPLAPGLPLRLDELQKRAKARIARYRAAIAAMKKTNSKEEWLQHIGASLAGASADAKSGVTATITADGSKAVQYGIRRVGRIRNEYASRLGDLASAFQSRPAFDADVVDGVARDGAD